MKIKRYKMTKKHWKTINYIHVHQKTKYLKEYLFVEFAVKGCKEINIGTID
jgi:hypothetical protein